MQDKFLKTLIYILLGIGLTIFLLIQPYNIYCKNSKKCYPITLSSFANADKGKKELTLNFEGQVPDNLKDIVEFKPEFTSIKKFSNEFVTNTYLVKNLSNNSIAVRAKYQISPETADNYIDRIECLCFQNQTLAPGEEVAMPIKFQIKKEFDQEKDLKEAVVSYNIEILE